MCLCVCCFFFHIHVGHLPHHPCVFSHPSAMVCSFHCPPLFTPTPSHDTSTELWTPLWLPLSLENKTRLPASPLHNVRECPPPLSTHWSGWIPSILPTIASGCSALCTEFAVLGVPACILAEQLTILDFEGYRTISCADLITEVTRGSAPSVWSIRSQTLQLARCCKKGEKSKMMRASLVAHTLGHTL